MRRWSGWWAMLMGGLLLAQGAWAVVPPQELVKTTAEQVLATLKERKQELDQNPGLVYAVVNDMVLPHFDFQRISRRVLGKNWGKATTKQQERFIAEFKFLLVRTYAKALVEYTDQALIYLPFTAEPGATKAEVNTEVEQPGGFPIPIDYRLHLKGEEWKVYDVRIDGVSLIANYRTTFTSEIRRDGMDQLIARLAERNKQARSE